MTLLKQFKNGLITENPTFVLLLGMCPTLATTTSIKNGIGMGLSATVVLTMSNLFISVLRKAIPKKIRIASYIVIISAFVTTVEMLLNAYFPDLAKQLGIFIPLIVVNCIILARAEAFASKNPVLPSIIDGLSMGLGFTMALGILGFIREILGNGTLFDFSLFGGNFNPATVMILPPGGFLTLGCVLGVINYLKDEGRRRKS
ncbi:MAG: electron transport complex subunit E [Clostridiaceae bacterium]|nr:electron transport complex subunit E [Clostridiaceae bacterium]